MKKNLALKEKHPLPLIYDYMEIVKNKDREKYTLNSALPCERYQTDFYGKSKPYKFLIRFL